jgi:hypothetical protein
VARSSLWCLWCVRRVGLTQLPCCSYADLWILASYEAISFMGGPDIEMTFGRTDAPCGKCCPPEHMLPDGHHHPGNYDAPGKVRETTHTHNFGICRLLCTLSPPLLPSLGYGRWHHGQCKTPCALDSAHGMSTLQWVATGCL